MTVSAKTFVISVGMLALMAGSAATQQKALRAQEASTGPAAPAASDNQKIGTGRTLRTETEITLVNVSVTDPVGRLVTGLQQDNFQIFENGQEQEIVKFTSEDV